MKDINYDGTIIELERELRHLCTVIKQKGREILTNFEITPPQFQALQYLITEENITIGELSNKMYLACSTITDLVDRMEKNSLVKRVRDNKDRRVVRIIVLDKGHEIINEVLHARRQYLGNILMDLNNGEKDNILKSIEMVYSRTVE
ncbi:MarR family winged helix-turn-helix transcriptional regulator [Alkaliphilus hydrothermalis]|uniref:DNA-binding MarR family transcriptional regulator n=1 Tax=Alkaliphilus hydrothermalis TaxID=1482730 RepID=A0ABS2NPL4_9FIRM|nr:MarR family transcriptional regulator [Alkaliphilus hydrothermalis]MBM7614847.1 DNA-binding MarR family transcriptional regulator [Alkaliphilus hydrothermalis]